MSFFTKCILFLFFITNISLLSARQLLYIGCYADDKIYTYDITRVVYPFPLGTIGGISDPRGIVFSPDAKYAYVTAFTRDQVIKIDTTTNLPVGQPIAVGSQPHGIAITPDGQFLYVTSYGSADISVISTETDTVVDTIAVTGSDSYQILFTPSGKFAYVTSNIDDTIHVINTETRTEITGSNYPISLSGRPRALTITPDGQLVYAVLNDNAKVAVIDTTDNQVQPLISVGNTPLSIDITPDGLFAYVANSGNSSNISIIDLLSNNAVTSFTDASIVNPRSLAITPDGRLVYVVDELGPIHLISTRSQAVVTLQNPISTGADSMVIAISPATMDAHAITAKVNAFLSIDYYNTISWSAPVNPFPLMYKIYRDKKHQNLIAKINCISELKYEDHNLSAASIYHYYIVAENAYGPVAMTEISATTSK